MKLGKKPAAPIKSTDLHLGRYRIGAPVNLPPLPATFGKIDMPDGRPWGMLGNDTVGCCVISWSAHFTMFAGALVGKTISFSDASVLQTYSEATGYDPADPSTDNGTEMASFMDWWRHEGIIDDAGDRHKLVAYARVNYHNPQELLEAGYLFKMPGLGIQFPDSAMTQTQRGETWDLIPAAQIEGGHCIGFDAYNGVVYNFCTWGQNQPATPRFLHAYLDEAFAPITPEMVDVLGRDSDGWDIDQLIADANALSV